MRDDNLTDLQKGIATFTDVQVAYLAACCFVEMAHRDMFSVQEAMAIVGVLSTYSNGEQNVDPRTN